MAIGRFWPIPDTQITAKPINPNCRGQRSKKGKNERRLEGAGVLAVAQGFGEGNALVPTPEVGGFAHGAADFFPCLGGGHGLVKRNELGIGLPGQAVQPGSTFDDHLQLVANG